MPETCLARRRYTLKTTQKPFGNFPIPDLEHLTITTPTLYTVAPRTLAPLYHCTFYIAPLHPLHRTHCPVAPLHRTPAPYQFSKKNIAKKQKHIAKYKDFAMFFCFFAMIFFWKLVRCRGATGQWVRLVGTWVQFTGYMGAISWYSGATSGYIPTYWQSPVHTFADRFPYLSQLCRKNHCLKPNSRKFNLVHFALEAFSRRQNLSASNQKR